MLRKDFKLLIGDKKSLIILVIVAVLIAAGVVFGNSEDGAPTVAVGICNEDTSDYSRLITAFFGENENYTEYVSIIEDEREALETMLSDGRLDMLLVIPEGFSGSLIRMENKPIEAKINSSDKTKAVLLNNLLDAYADYITSVEQNCETLYRVMQDEGLPSELIDAKNVEISYDLVLTALGKDSFFLREEADRMKGIPLTSYYAYAACFLLLGFCGIYAGLNLFCERSSGMLYRMRTTGRSMAGLLFCKLLFFFISCSTVAAAAAFALGAGYGTVAVCLSDLVFMIMLCMLAGSLFASRQSYIIAANMTLLLLLICGGGVIPITYLPQGLARLSRVLPLYSFIRAAGGEGISQRTVVYCVACIVLSAAMFAATTYRLSRSYIVSQIA